MTPGQILLSVASVALIGVLYFFVPTVASKKTTQATEAVTAENGHQHPAFDLAAYKTAKIAALPADVQSNIEALEKEAASKETLLQLNELYIQNRIPLLACEAIKAIAEKENVAKDWDKAGDAYMAVSMIEEKDAGLSHYALESAISSYQKATELNPENTDYTVKLASAIMEMGEEAMQGVQLLLGIIKDNPDHIPANLILGRYGIVSGQFDKAVQRLEKVVKLDPTNTEAYFYLAEAYNGIGRKEDAIETFEKCKKLVNDPGFSAEIDNYIKKIKNS
jgi:tetratricopeptide (TPR) repeat protein